MGILLVVTHPHKNVCGEVTHWDRTPILTVKNRRMLETYVPDAERVWGVVQRYGSYQRAAGLPYYPVWLGTHGGLALTPELSPTADWVWSTSA